MYIYQLPDWPHFSWDCKSLINPLATVRFKQGLLAGRMGAIDATLQSEALLKILTFDIIKSNEIEGIIHDEAQVRHFVATRLGLKIGDTGFPNRTVESLVLMALDATQHYNKPLSKDKLFGWHAALFPTGYTDHKIKIRIGNWRDDMHGPMQVVSGPNEHKQIHFEAPPSSILENEMTDFLSWLNCEQNIDPVLKAGIAHIWLLTLHPFGDGNGRIARILSDMLLQRSEQSPYRFYSLSTQIALERDGYYAMLEDTQKGNMDITKALLWFLNCLGHAIDASENLLADVLRKSRLQKFYSNLSFNDRQHLVLNKLIENINEKITSTEWSKMTGCSQDTAARDIKDLLNRGILSRNSSGGRSTNYSLIIR